jgi:hypothetical protein
MDVRVSSDTPVYVKESINKGDLAYGDHKDLNWITLTGKM